MSRIRIDPASRLPLDPIPVEKVVSHREENHQGYVELSLRTCFSFLQAASRPEEIIHRAAELGYQAIAVTDRDGLYGIVRAHEEAKKHGVRVIVGAELTVNQTAPHTTLVVLVENQAGYSNLCRILTRSHALHPKGKPRRQGEGVARNCFAGVPIELVCENAEGLWCLSVDQGERDVEKLRRAFGERLSIAVHRHLDGSDDERVRRAEALSRKFEIPIVATNAVRYARRDGKRLFDVVHCIRENLMLESAGRALSPNAEAHLKNEREMCDLFADHPKWLERSTEIARACTFDITSLKYKFPYEIDKPAFEGETADQALRRMTYAGADHRYPEGLPEKIGAQIEKELALIAHMDVAPYFLSVRTIIDMAVERDILCQGRGSAANSAVCFCLGITAIDPARSNLLFERFLSADRHEPPDIDVDFEHERREEVIQAIYEKYGRDRAAMVSEVVSYRGKSALRDVGKVFGLSLEQVDRLASVVSWWDQADQVRAGRLRDAGFDPNDSGVAMVLEMARAISGFPRHLSVHVGGFVLSSEPLVAVAPIEPATMPGRTVIPWDKDDLDTLGFFKVDVLALGMLTALRKALAMIQTDERVRAPNAIDSLAKIPPEDKVVYEALCHADTVGVFQIESRAQMSMLPRLKPRTFYDLVVEVAIVRPGPIQGGMIHPYLRRRNGEEPSDPPHPILKPILARTLGVPLFQEQVMQIAIVGAGYTGGEADQLRRDMAAWKKNGRLEGHRERLERGFAERGITKEFSEKLYAQIKGFGEYGFPESHSASFALLVYASSWIKVHHPAEFAVALVNSQPMGFYSPSTILQDAARHGVTVLPITVAESDWDSTVEMGAIRVGLRQVRGLGEESGKRIESARRDKPFSDIEDLAARTQLNQRELELLAESGALGPLSTGRREAIWQVRAPRGEPLFEGIDIGELQPLLPTLTRSEQLMLDYAATGLSVADHPMKIAREKLPVRVRSSRDLAAMEQGQPAVTAGLVICRQRPGTASGVVFITMEDEYGFINLILWSRVFESLRHVATTSTMLTAEGKVERSGEVVYVIVERLTPLSLKSMSRVPGMSRDFH